MCFIFKIAGVPACDQVVCAVGEIDTSLSASQINADLATCETVMQKIFQEFEVRDEVPTKDQIKTRFNARMAVQDPNAETAPDKDEDKGKKKKKEPAKRSFFDYYDESYRQTARLHNRIASEIHCGAQPLERFPQPPVV